MPLEEHELRTAEPAAPPPPGAIEAALAGIPALPADALILVPTRSLVLFPGTVLPVTLGRQRSVAAAQAAIRLNRPVGLVLQRDPATDDPIPVDLHRMGTEANILRYVTSPDGQHHVISQGERRFRILEFLDGYPFLVARIERVAESDAISKDIEARMLNLRNQAIEVLQLLPQTPVELVNAVQSATAPAGARRHDRRVHGHHPGREAGNPRNHRHREPARTGVGDAGLPHRGVAAVAPDQRADQGKDRRSPARVPVARADEDDPEGARRGRRRQEPGDRRARRKRSPTRRCRPRSRSTPSASSPGSSGCPRRPANIRWRAPISNG